MLKSYTTLAGARRANPGQAVIRILADPQEVWVPIPRMDTDIMIFIGGETCSSGSIRAFDLVGSEARG